MPASQSRMSTRSAPSGFKALAFEIAGPSPGVLADLAVAHDPAELERLLTRRGARAARDGDDAAARRHSGEQCGRAAEHVAAGQILTGGCPAHRSSSKLCTTV